MLSQLLLFLLVFNYGYCYRVVDNPYRYVPEAKLLSQNITLTYKNDPICAKIGSVLLAVPAPKGINIGPLDGDWFQCNKDITLPLEYRYTLNRKFVTDFGMSVKSTQLSWFIDAKIEDTVFRYLNISLMFIMKGSITYQNIEMDIQSVGTISNYQEWLPFTAHNHLLLWKGVVYGRTTKYPQLEISDVNLFDSVPASAYIQIPAPIELNETYYQVTDLIVSNVANIVTLADPIFSAPTALKGSARCIAMLPSSLPSTSLVGKTVVLNDDTEMTLLVQSQISCSGDNCQSYIYQCFEELIDLPQCTELIPVRGSLQSQLLTDISISGSTIIVNSVSAQAQITFQCNGDYISVSIGLATSGPSSIPTELFLTDVKAAVGMTKSIPLIPYGTISGKFNSGSDLYTILMADIFTDTFGGTAVKDIPWSVDAETRLINEMNSLPAFIQTNVVVINNGVIQIFDIASRIQTYKNDPSQYHTILGFLTWLDLSDDRIKVFIPPTGPIILSISVGTQGSVAWNDIAFNAFNNELTSLCALISPFIIPPQLSPNSLVSSSARGFISATLDVSCLVSSQSTCELTQPLSYAGTMKAQLQFINNDIPASWVQYDYLTNQILVIAQVAYPVQELVTRYNGHLAVYSEILFKNQYLSDVDTVSDNIKQTGWAGLLSPILLDLSKFGTSSTTSSDVFLNFKTAISQTTSSFNMAQSMMNYLESTIADSYTCIYPNIVVVNNIFQIRVTTYSLHHVHMQAGDWQIPFDNSRMDIPLIISREYQFSLGDNNVQAFYMNAHGCSHHSAWTVPFRYGMLSGIVLHGNLDLCLDLPGTTSQMNLTVDVMTDYGSISGGVTISHIASNDINFVQNKQVYLSNDLNLVYPDQVFDSLKSIPLQAIPSIFDGLINFPLPGFMNTLPIDESFAPLSLIFAWLTVPTSIRPVLASSLSIELNIIPDETVYEFDINQGKNFTCTTRFTDKRSFNAIVSTITNSFQSCGVSQYITVTSDVLRNTISLYPAVDGLVWSFVMTSSVIFNDISSQIRPIPIFSSWNDLGWIITLCFKTIQTYIRPQLITISPTQVPNIVPVELQPYYSSLFGVSLDFNLRVESSLNDALVTQINTDIVSLNGPSGTVVGSIQSDLNFTIMGLFGCPPLGGGNNISLSSNLNQPLESAYILSSPNNTLSIQIDASAYYRSSKHSVENI